METNTEVSYPGVPPLPSTVVELQAQRKVMRPPSLNDEVDRCHCELWDNRDYRALFAALWSSEAVEGHTTADDLRAADFIRRHAIENRIPIAASAKLWSLVLSLRVVCRRYGIGRPERRNLVNGQQVRNHEQIQHAAE